MTNGHTARDWVKSVMVNEIIPKIQSYTVPLQPNPKWAGSLRLVVQPQNLYRKPNYKYTALIRREQKSYLTIIYSQGLYRGDAELQWASYNLWQNLFSKQQSVHRRQLAWARLSHGRNFSYIKLTGQYKTRQYLNLEYMN